MGATSGIGRMLAEKLAGEGWLVGAAGRNKSALEELQKTYPDNVITERIDVTVANAPVSMLNLIKKMDGMDVYFHVSGIMYENSALNISEEVKTLETNVVGYARMISTAFRYFRETKRPGRIAAVTSVAGTKGIGRLASYSSSKRFQQTYLTALNQLANIEGLDIKFTDIRPGWINTSLVDPSRQYPMMMELPYAAARIFKALMSGRRIKVVDWRWAVLTSLWRLIPDSLWVKMPVEISSPDYSTSDDPHSGR